MHLDFKESYQIGDYSVILNISNKNSQHENIFIDSFNLLTTNRQAGALEAILLIFA